MTRTDAPADALAFILAGTIHVIRSDFIMRRIGRYQFVGLSAASAGAPLTADLAAPEHSDVDLHVLLIPGPVFREVLSLHPPIAYRVISHLAKLVGTLSDELESRKLDLGARLAKRLCALAQHQGSDLPCETLRFKHAELASMVQATPMNVARTISKYRNLGLLKPYRQDGLLEIADLRGLSEYAGKTSRRGHKRR